MNWFISILILVGIWDVEEKNQYLVQSAMGLWIRRWTHSIFIYFSVKKRGTISFNFVISYIHTYRERREMENKMSSTIFI